MNQITNGISFLEKTNYKLRDSKELANELIATLKGRKITILGHDNIDVDATLSGILMSKLLDFLQIENQFCILEPVKENDTYEIIKELLGINMKMWEVVGELEDRNLFLLDHYETIHKGKVLGCIDHHPNKQKINYEFIHETDSCATAYLIYQLMEAVNFPLEKLDAKMIIVSMMVDTVSFKSSKTVKEEIVVAKWLAEKYHIDYEFLEKYCWALTPIDEMTVEQIISNGQKWYNYAGKKVGSSYVQVYGFPSNTQVRNWLNCLDEKLHKTSSDMLVLLIIELHENKTYEYQITKDSIKERVREGIVSRGQDIMPAIEARYVEQKSTEEKLKVLVERLTNDKQTIATMESCTGGQLASEITNMSGASEILKESYVSYSNEAKIKFGVSSEIIEKYTVYSPETALAMAKAVRSIANSKIGVGITGQWGRIDPNNPGCPNNTVWYAIADGSKEQIFKMMITSDLSRYEKKRVVTREIIEALYR